MVNKGVVIDVPPTPVAGAAKVDADIEAWTAKNNPEKNKKWEQT